MAEYKLFCLGRPVLELDGKPVKLEMRKSLALLVYLRLAGRDCSRESLAALLWPEYDQQHAQANLRRTLASLNKSLRIDLLEADREKIGLREPSRIWLDVEEFLEQLATGKTHPHPQDETCPECQLALEKAIQLYRGDFLEGFNLSDCPTFDDWQFLQRESLRQELGQALQKLAEACASQSQWKPAIAQARRWVGLDPLDESAQRCLISLYAQGGQRNAALRQYEELLRTLQEELGQGPASETADLYQKIQEGPQASAQTESKALPSPKAPLPMVEPLLKTKLYIPFVRGEKVHRERLISALNQIEEFGLAILSAPAGFGKTTALTEWVAQSHLQIGWISLDSGDNDPARFLSYLVAALDSIQSGIGRDAQMFLHSAHSVPLAVVLVSLIHDLETIPYPFVLVLDDYQSIEAQLVHQAVTYLLDHLPANMHVLIATRADPPLQLARLRSQSQLLEIRSRDLYFTLDEAGVYLNRVMRLGLSEADVAALMERTEGWIVGLKMAAIALQSQLSGQKPVDTAEFIQAFSGSNRYILDYLVEEVLGRQPETIKHFLLKTSILESLSGSLCDAVTEIRDSRVESSNESLISILDSQSILENLERANLFVVPLDNERLWYRYHHLFADLLSNQLNRGFPPEHIRDLHRRASQWFELNNLSDKAMHHALIAGDYERATRIVEQNAFQMIGQGEMSTLMSWIARLPDEIVDESLPLLRFKIWGLGFAGQVHQAEALFSKIEAILDVQPQSIETQTVRGELALFRGVAANYRCEFQQAMDQCHTALALIPESRNRVRAIAVFALGDIYRAQGDLAQSTQEFVEAGRMAVEFGEFWSQIQSLWTRAVVSEIQGRLHEAEDFYQQAYQIASGHGLQPGSVVMVDVGMSGLLYEWNQLDQARRLLTMSVEDISWSGTMHWWENPNMVVPGFLTLARLLKITGEMQAARTAIEKAAQLCKEFNVYPDICSQVQAELVRLWLEQGELVEAADWLEKYQADEGAQWSVWHEREQIAGIRVLIAMGRIAEVQNQISRLTVAAESGGRIHRLIEILILQALALHSVSNIPEALDVLQRALTLAISEGYVRTFIDEGAPMQALLQLLSAKLPSEAQAGKGGTDDLNLYVNILLEAFQTEPPNR